MVPTLSEPETPPPSNEAIFVVKIQLQIAEFVERASTPPPSLAKPGVDVSRVAPPQKVNPFKIVLFVIQTQRIAPGPYMEVGSQAPWMMVAAAPLTLSTIMDLLMETRLVLTPSMD